jgi:tetratricopeptide (TPR) repeat protein
MSAATATEATSPKANSETIRFTNNDKYQAALNELVVNPPLWDATKAEQIAYLWKLSSAEFKLRYYADAESSARDIIKLEPKSAPIHDLLSECLGKQAKYEDAIAEAQEVIRLDHGAAMHANLVLASWEWLTGKKDEALKRAASVALPKDKPGQCSYYGALIYFYATAGDEEKTADAITKASAVDEDGTLVDFLGRDTVFDPYREKDWFSKLFVKIFLGSKPEKEVSTIRHWFYLATTPEKRVEAAAPLPVK